MSLFAHAFHKPGAADSELSQPLHHSDCVSYVCVGTHKCHAVIVAVSRRQLRVRSGGDARIGYAALVLRSTLEVDRALPSAVLSTHKSR